MKHAAAAKAGAASASPSSAALTPRPAAALFLDRDGVINVDHAYVHRVADFDFMPGIFDLVRCAHRLGLHTIVVTNQAGIGRGLYSEADFAVLTAWMCERFAEQGAPISRVYHCPTHPTAGLGAYRVESTMRKPAPGMLLAAQRDFDIDMPGSLMLGDKPGDVQAGQAAGVGLNLLLADADASVRLPPGGERVASLAQAQARLVQFRLSLQAGGPTLHSGLAGPAGTSDYTARA